MTFHRFLDGIKPKLRLFVDGDTAEFRVKAWDPFYRSNAATQGLAEARRGLHGSSVVLRGFVLPHKDRIPASEHEVAAGPMGWLGHEGFYVYRNERLIVAGSWLGLGKPKRWGRDEQHKLARIQLDIPNSLDKYWGLDIRKSKSTPPLELKEWITRLAGNIRGEAREVFVHRGTYSPAQNAAGFSTLWLAGVGASPNYRINRDHPAVAASLSKGTAQGIEHLLRLLESAVPVHRIWLDVSDKPEAPPSQLSLLPDSEVIPLAKDLLLRIMAGHGLHRKEALERLRSTEPFDQYPHVLAALESH